MQRIANNLFRHIGLLFIGLGLGLILKATFSYPEMLPCKDAKNIDLPPNNVKNVGNPQLVLRLSPDCWTGVLTSSGDSQIEFTLEHSEDYVYVSDGMMYQSALYSHRAETPVRFYGKGNLKIYTFIQPTNPKRR